MIHINSLIIILPLLPAPQYIPENKFAEAIPYSSFYIEQPKLKNTMEFNTMTMEELIKENNEQILQQIYKNIE